MIIRYGFYEGQVQPDRQAEFDAHFRDVVIPGLARMPGIAAVRLLRGIAQDAIKPRFHHIIELTCLDEDALARAMRSEERRALQSGPWGVMDFYDGATPHANFTVIASLDGQGVVAEYPQAAPSKRALLGLARVGRAGMEKPVIVYGDGEIRDVSIFISEIDRSLIGSDWASAVSALDSERMPRVDPAARNGPCVEFHRRLIATEFPGLAARKPLRAALRAGRLAGASDDLLLPAGRAFGCRAGIAAVIKAGDVNDPEISGVCLFLACNMLEEAGIDAENRGVVASSPGMVSLGPYLVDMKSWQPASGTVRLAINGIKVDGISVKADDLQELVARLNRLVGLETGDIVLAGALGPASSGRSSRKLARGDRIVVTAPLIGRQERLCRCAPLAMASSIGRPTD